MKKIAFLLVLIGGVVLTNVQAQNMMHTKHYNSHFEYQTSLSFNAGVGDLKFGNRHLDNKLPNYCLDQVLEYQFNPYVSLGVDLGLNFWKHTAFIPVALHLGVNCMDYTVSPHFYLNAGYSFKWYMSMKPEKMTKVIHGAKAGWYINSGLGINLRLGEQLHLILAADYKMQYSTLQYSVPIPNADYDYSSVITNRTQNMFYHFVGVKVGLLYW